MKFERIKEILHDDKIRLEERFIIACVLVDKLNEPLKINITTQLIFYGLFKQAIFGDCNKPKPPLTQMGKRALWNAWDTRKGTTIPTAQKNYIDFGLDTLKKQNQAILHKVCAEFTEEELTKFVLDKLTVTAENPATRKPNVCILEQAEALEDEKASKFWKAIAEEIQQRSKKLEESKNLTSESAIADKDGCLSKADGILSLNGFHTYEGTITLKEGGTLRLSDGRVITITASAGDIKLDHEKLAAAKDSAAAESDKPLTFSAKGTSAAAAMSFAEMGLVSSMLSAAIPAAAAASPLVP